MGPEPGTPLEKVLLALSAKVAARGVPVFACTPDQFPELMATALRREDVHGWAADRDIKLVRSDG